MRNGWVKKGSSVMEFAVCYDHSSFDLARSIFLDVTAFFALMAPWAIARLVEISREDGAARLQAA
ncbi:conserved hypothetical protein [Mesorhizobium plurifarium]|uniref:Uncharacterized protein n=2 Tax=Mesorhizobium plurifarium TaxID=69974 RepID=A0A090DJB0_MESPL|nr:conserved hypothetical protein [Mesorhizobium plurifarium]